MTRIFDAEYVWNEGLFADNFPGNILSFSKYPVVNITSNLLVVGMSSVDSHLIYDLKAVSK